MPVRDRIADEREHDGYALRGLLRRERCGFVAGEDHIHARFHQRFGRGGGGAGLAFGEAYLIRHVTPFDDALLAHSLFESLDRRMVGGEGLVKDPDAIRANRLGLGR